MNFDTLFIVANAIAIFAWLPLFAYPLAPQKIIQTISGLVIPLLLSATYTAVLLFNWGTGEGNFSSLNGVMTLFQNPASVLAGWVHYLAFDLFVGAWIVRTAIRDNLHYLVVLPCLPLTLMFGPLGFAAFCVLRLCIKRFNQ